MLNTCHADQHSHRAAREWQDRRPTPLATAPVGSGRPSRRPTSDDGRDYRYNKRIRPVSRGSGRGRGFLIEMPHDWPRGPGPRSISPPSEILGEGSAVPSLPARRSRMARPATLREGHAGLLRARDQRHNPVYALHGREYGSLGNPSVCTAPPCFGNSRAPLSGPRPPPRRASRAPPRPSLIRCTFCCHWCVAGCVGGALSLPGVTNRARGARAITQPPSRLRSVQLTVVDREGHRHVLRGLEGQTVADVLENNVELFGDDGEPVDGDGRERGGMPGLPNVIANVCIYSLQSW